MISYTQGDRRSLKFESGNWMEEVLTASGVKVDSSGFSTVTGTSVAELLNNIDNSLTGLTNITATGIVLISDVSNISGTVGETLENLDVISLPSGSNSQFRFSFTVPAQPTNPVKVQLAVIPRGSGQSGNVKLKMDYNIFEQGVDVTPGDFGSSSIDVTQSIVAGDFEKIKLINLQIPTANFSASGSAPFLVNCRVTRDVSVGGNYARDVSIASIMADNVPGGIIGNVAGYTGGNLLVTGDLTLSGNLVLAGSVAAPASGTATGISGSVVLADDFLYAAVAANSWKRININTF